MAAPKKPVAKKAPAKPTKAPMTKGKTVKPSKPAYTGPWFNEKGKPDPYGLYDKDQYMKRSSAPRDKFEKQAKAPADSDAAKRAGYSR